MLKNSYKLLFCLIVVIGFTGFPVTEAQPVMPLPKFPDNWIFRLSIGKTQFYGDASHDDKWEKLIKESRLCYVGSVRKQFGKVVGGGTELFYSKVRSRKGENNLPYPLHYVLNSYYTEFNVFAYIDLSALIFRDGFLHRFSVYSTVGIGYAFWDSELEDVVSGAKRYSGNSYDGKYFRKGGVVIPASAGVKYNINFEWLVFIEGHMRTILNDQLDVWYSGSPFDFLFVASVGVSYRFRYPKWPRSDNYRRYKANRRFIEKLYYSR